MKIIKNDKRKTSYFENIKMGESFEYRGDAFTRVREVIDSNGLKVNAVNLADGMLYLFNDMIVVNLIDSAVIVDDVCKPKEDYIFHESAPNKSLIDRIIDWVNE